MKPALFGAVTSFILLLDFGHLSNGLLTIKPQNKALAGTGGRNISMNCSSNLGSDAIRWTFTLYDTSFETTVAVGETVNPNYAKLFWIDQPNANASNILMFESSNITSGTYRCSDGSFTASAQYFYIGLAGMSRKSNISSSGLVNGDVYYHSFKVCYYGNEYITPLLYMFLKWPEYAYNFTNLPITREESLKCVNATVIETAECGVIFPRAQFYLFFSAPKGSLPSDSATNAPDFSSGIGYFTPMNVTCVPTDKNMTINGLINGNSALFGSELICQVTSNSTVSYLWIDQRYGNTTSGSRIKVWHNGTYQCNASAYWNGKLYSASKTIYNLIIIAGAASGNSSNGQLLSKPINKVEWGDSWVRNTSMNCSSSRGSNAINWFFTLFDTKINATVAVGSKVTPCYAHLFWIHQPDPLTSNLMIYEVSNLTAGTYTCSDGTAVASAQLATFKVYRPKGLGSKNNITNNTLFNGDVFFHSCSVCYYGNDFITPIMRLVLDYPKTAFIFTNPEITRNGTLKCAWGTTIETATCGVVFSRFAGYFTTFSEPKGDLPPGSATNAPSASYSNSYFGPINVTCVPTEKNMTISGLVAENTAFFGSTLTCEVTSAPAVTYIWIDMTYGNSTSGQSIKVWHNGTYQCRASADWNGKLYTAVKTLSNLLVIQKSPCIN